MSVSLLCTVPQVTREELERVDLEIPTAFAQASKSSGCVRHISLLGSVGADADAKPGKIMEMAAGWGIYLSTKGKVGVVTTDSCLLAVLGVGLL